MTGVTGLTENSEYLLNHHTSPNFLKCGPHARSITLFTCPFREYQGLDELLTRSCDKTNPLIKQLDAIDSVARLWLEMASKLDLNIFKGFKDEKSLLDFALNVNNSKKGDTAKVVAGQC